VTWAAGDDGEDEGVQMALQGLGPHTS